MSKKRGSRGTKRAREIDYETDATGRERKRVVTRCGNKAYQVVVEQFTRIKKKLTCSISYDLTAPLNYTFVPFGAPELSRRAREICRRFDLMVYIVSTAPDGEKFDNPNCICHHIYHIGHHFPTQVVSLACEWEGYTVHNGIFIRDTNNSNEGASWNKSLMEQTGCIKQDHARLVIRDLYPYMPSSTMDQIIAHSFNKMYPSRVGNCSNLPLARCVQLAVVAHIRHVYTDYDVIIRVLGRGNARNSIESRVLQKLIEWRGEGEAEEEMDLRQVIVIDGNDEVEIW